MPLFVILALFLLSLPGAAAHAQDRIPYRIVWMIVPEPMPAETTRTVGNRTTLLSAPLRPERLFRLESDARASSGGPLLKAGAHLVAAQSPVVIACSPAKARRGLMNALDITRDHFQCLLDGDGDGRFEAAFRHIVAPPQTPLGPATTTLGVLVGAGRTPARPEPIAPVAYVEESPDALKDAPRLHLQYGWYAALANALVFQSCFQPDDPSASSCFETHGLRPEDVPGVIRAHGAELRVESRERPGVRVTILSTFAAEPLVVETTPVWP